MFISAFIKEMNFVGSSNGDSRIDRNIGNCDPNDSLMAVS